MTRPPVVLIVEDDEDDLFLTQRTVSKHSRGPILHVESGRAAIAYFAGAGRYSNRAEFPLPDIVFLDLKMADLTGHDVLAWIRDHVGPPLPRIFVLTGSNEPRDRDRVRAAGVASGYIVKPLLGEHLCAAFGEWLHG